MYRTIESRGEGMLHSAQFVLHYLKKNEEAFKSSMFDAGIVRFLLLHSIYCMYQNIYKGGSLECAQYWLFFHSGKFHNHTHDTRTHISRLSINMYECVVQIHETTSIKIDLRGVSGILFFVCATGVTVFE